MTELWSNKERLKRKKTSRYIKEKIIGRISDQAFHVLLKGFRTRRKPKIIIAQSEDETMGAATVLAASWAVVVAVKPISAVPEATAENLERNLVKKLTND